MAKLRKKIIEFPNQVPTPGSAFLYAKKNPNNTFTTSNTTLEQLVTLIESQIVFPPSGGSILYSNVYFVDEINGNNLTALPSDMSKPYADISTALNAASISGLYNVSNRALIHVRKGTYTETIFLDNNIDLYFDPTTILNGEFRDNGNSINSNIYGKCKFRGSRSFFITGNSNIFCEFDNAENSSSFLIALANVEANLNIIGNYVKADGIGTAYGNTIRGNVNLNFELKEYGSSIQTFLDIRNSYSGKLRVKIPEIHLTGGDNFGIDFKQCIYIRHCLNADIKIEAKLINDTTDFGSLYGLFAGVNISNTKIEIIGDIIGLNGTGLYYAADDTLSTLSYTGNIVTDNKIMYLGGSGKVLFNNCNINQFTNTSNRIFDMDGNATIQCNNVLIKYDSTAVIDPTIVFYTSTDSNICNLINTYAYSVAGVGNFAKGGTWTINGVNCMSNIDIDNISVTNNIIGGFTLDTNFILI